MFCFDLIEQVGGSFEECLQKQRFLLGLFAAGAPKVLGPVPFWRGFSILGAEHHCSVTRIAQVALIGVVAVDAEAVPAAQGAHNLVWIMAFAVESDAFLGARRGCR
ncbi:hypothetical protein D3C77_430930 [compost metagenome]